MQSGVKPIVDAIQIKTFYKMVTFFEECDRLIIIVFNANIDDNHINGLIKNYFENMELIYLDYIDKPREKIIRNVLRLSDSSSLRYFQIDDENSYKTFKELLEDGK